MTLKNINTQYLDSSLCMMISVNLFFIIILLYLTIPIPDVSSVLTNFAFNIYCTPKSVVQYLHLCVILHSIECLFEWMEMANSGTQQLLYALGIT